MLRTIALIGLILGVMALLMGSGWLPPPIHALVAYAFRITLFLIAPSFLAMFFLAPGLFPSLSNEARALWQKFTGRETQELISKIEQLDKPHHLVQLGTLYSHAARFAKARPWFAKALEREPDLLEARYRLGVCAFHAEEYPEAERLLEEVYAEKPGYDYGMAYLRLAQTHARQNHYARAEEIFETMLRYYPGHAEACYSYGGMLAEQGLWIRASQQMRTLIQAVRHSPGFQRRRNRHWALKAWWWLFRHDKRSEGVASADASTESTTASANSSVANSRHGDHAARSEPASTDG